MSLTRHPLFWDIRPYVHPEGTGPIRLTVPDDPILRSAFLNMTVACVSCGRTVRPIRRAVSWLEYNPACASVVCQRSIEATEEYDDVRTAVLMWRIERARMAAGDDHGRIH